MLIVVEDRDFHGLLQRLFNVKTLRRLDIFQVDSAESGLQNLARADDFVGVLGIQLDIEDVDIGEALEEHALAFHDGFAGERADIPEAQHGGSVAHHAHQVGFSGVGIGEGRVPFDLQAGNGYPGGIRQAQVALRAAGLGGHHGNFAGGWCGMILQCIFGTNGHKSTSIICDSGCVGHALACPVVAPRDGSASM